MNTVCNLGDEVLTLYLFYLTRQALVDTVCFSLVCRAGPYKTELYKMVSRADNFNETISASNFHFKCQYPPPPAVFTCLQQPGNECLVNTLVSLSDSRNRIICKWDEPYFEQSVGGDREQAEAGWRFNTQQSNWTRVRLSSCWCLL